MFFSKIYLSLYLKGLCVRGSWKPNRTATYWPPLLWPLASLSRSPGLLNRRPGAQLSDGSWLSLPHLVSKLVWSPKLLNRGSWGPFCQVLAFSTASCHQTSLVSKLTDFLSSLSYIIVQSPTYLPITDHRNVSLPPSLEWHVWSSLSGNNCHAVHRSLSSGASVCGCTVGF